MKISEILDKAADLIEPPGKWTQVATARDADDNPVLANNDRAVCFCMGGAVIRSGRNSMWPESLEYLRSVFLSRFEQWNDAPERNQSEVVAKLREIAEQARAEGK